MSKPLLKCYCGKRIYTERGFLSHCEYKGCLYVGPEERIGPLNRYPQKFVAPREVEADENYFDTFIDR